MQTCSRCNASSPDTEINCINCQADLREFATVALALRKFRDNPRVRSVRITVAHDACPMCYEMRGTFAKDAVPVLPHEGCSHNHGCRCMYEPVLSEIYP